MKREWDLKKLNTKACKWKLGYTHTQILHLESLFLPIPKTKILAHAEFLEKNDAVKNYQRYTKTNRKYAKSQKYSQIMEHNWCTFYHGWLFCLFQAQYRILFLIMTLNTHTHIVYHFSLFRFQIHENKNECSTNLHYKTKNGGKDNVTKAQTCVSFNCHINTI